MSECLKDIDKRVNEWYERVAKSYYWLVDVVKYYKVVDLLDILFLGVVNTCTVYRCCDCEFSDIFCDDVFVEIHELCHYVPGRYAFHMAPEVIKTLWDISNSAYRVAKETSLDRVERIWKNRLHVLLGYFEMPYSARTLVLIDMYYPKRQVLSSARKLNLKASGISMEANIMSKRLNVKLGNCEIKYEEDTGLSVSKECPNTPELCDVMEAIFSVVESSINIFEKISREGVRVVTTYLLY